MAYTNIKADDLERIAAALRRLQDRHIREMPSSRGYPLLERVDIDPVRGPFGILRDGSFLYADGRPL